MRWCCSILLLALSICLFSERRALVIGIGEYPDVDYGWHSINGDNDVPLVVEMLEINGFQRSHIITLVNKEATYAGVIQALEKLIRQSNEGDIVYIHFSGHGQQITDLNGDEADGYDEAWIPYDALQEPTETYYGELHIIDDELNQYLHHLRKQIGESGRIIVVSDACHSGTATRNLTEKDIIRGSSAKFLLTKQPARFPTPAPIEWIAISACTGKECNRQVKTPNGNPCGSLSYALYLMRSTLSLLTANQLVQRLKKQLQPPFIARPQTPQVEYPATMKDTKLF